jgi:membrane-bound serine protease (ClpP class)
LLSLLLFALPVHGEYGETVYIIAVEGLIDFGLANFLERVLGEAKQQGVRAVILEIDTPGGLIDSATRIGRLLREHPQPVYAFIRGRALSAGAYIALSADAFFMTPGSVIGAAEPVVIGVDEPVDEKLVSAWAAHMRSAAEEQGKDPDVAEAMVRPEVVIEGIIERDELLTLTTDEAQKLGFSNGTFITRGELLAHLGLGGASVVEHEMGWLERFARWLTHPVIATILLTIGITGLLIEVFSPGFGIAGGVSLLAFSLFFGGPFLVGIIDYLPIVLFLVGVALIVAEFFVPAFGILGVGGLGAIGASIVMAAPSVLAGFQMIGISVVVAAIALFILFRFLGGRSWLHRLVLDKSEKKEEGYVAAKGLKDLEGLEGITLTPLRPAGSAEIGGNKVDVIAEGDFIPRNVKIKVFRVEGAKIVVRQV